MIDEKINELLHCRYITYAVKPEQSYVISHIRRFISRNDEIYIIGAQEEEIEALATYDKVSVQFDEAICEGNSKCMPKYSVLTLGNATIVEGILDTDLQKIFFQKYGRDIQGTVICVNIDTLIK